MAEYVYPLDQTVLADQNVLLQDSIPCNKGYVIHRNGSGILTLRGIVNNPCARFARYFVEFNGNIAVPEGGTPGEISVALAIDIVKDCSVICAMEEYGKNPEEEMYSSTGYYGRNSRGYVHDPMRNQTTAVPMYSSTMGYSRDGGAKQSMRHDLEMKLANARNEEERQMYMRMMDALER